jgi:hypothetical protein
VLESGNYFCAFGIVAVTDCGTVPQYEDHVTGATNDVSSPFVRHFISQITAKCGE